MIDIVKLFTPFSTLGEKSLSFEDKKIYYLRNRFIFRKNTIIDYSKPWMSKIKNLRHFFTSFLLKNNKIVKNKTF